MFASWPRINERKPWDRVQLTKAERKGKSPDAIELLRKAKYLESLPAESRKEITEAFMAEEEKVEEQNAQDAGDTSPAGTAAEPGSEALAIDEGTPPPEEQTGAEPQDEPEEGAAAESGEAQG
ncbi:MAG: hypothetical protein PHS14_18615 [Elusimicrobia bacterium]|nr:hypothetical protein [Elusimicrobiota bacterium]